MSVTQFWISDYGLSPQRLLGACNRLILDLHKYLNLKAKTVEELRSPESGKIYHCHRKVLLYIQRLSDG